MGKYLKSSFSYIWIVKMNFMVGDQIRYLSDDGIWHQAQIHSIVSAPGGSPGGSPVALYLTIDQKQVLVSSLISRLAPLEEQKHSSDPPGGPFLVHTSNHVKWKSMNQELKWSMVLTGHVSVFWRVSFQQLFADAQQVTSLSEAMVDLWDDSKLRSIHANLISEAKSICVFTSLILSSIPKDIDGPIDQEIIDILNLGTIVNRLNRSLITFRDLNSSLLNDTFIE